MTRNRFSFDMRFEFAVASRATKRMRTKNETRFRCDSKERKKNRIRRRSKKRRDRIRRRSKKKKNRIRRRSKEKKKDRTQRRYRRRLEDIIDDSKFESFVRLRTNSTSTTTTIAYLINVAKHKKRILYESFFRLHFFSSEL
jgi:chromatin remodeling complex protein RSC6